MSKNVKKIALYGFVTIFLVGLIIYTVFFITTMNKLDDPESKDSGANEIVGSEEVYTDASKFKPFATDKESIVVFTGYEERYQTVDVFQIDLDGNIINQCKIQDKRFSSFVPFQSNDILYLCRNAPPLEAIDGVWSYSLQSKQFSYMEFPEKIHESVEIQNVKHYGNKLWVELDSSYVDGRQTDQKSPEKNNEEQLKGIINSYLNLTDKVAYESDPYTTSELQPTITFQNNNTLHTACTEEIFDTWNESIGTWDGAYYIKLFLRNSKGDVVKSTVIKDNHFEYSGVFKTLYFNDYAFIIPSTYPESEGVVYYRVDDNLNVEKLTLPNEFQASLSEDAIKVGDKYWLAGENGIIYIINYKDGKISIEKRENQTEKAEDIVEFKVAYSDKVLAVHYYDQKPNEFHKKALRVYDQNANLISETKLPKEIAYVSLVDFINKEP